MTQLANQTSLKVVSACSDVYELFSSRLYDCMEERISKEDDVAITQVLSLLQEVVESNGYDIQFSYKEVKEQQSKAVDMGFKVNPDDTYPGFYVAVDPNGESMGIAYSSEREAWEHIIEEMPSYEEADEVNAQIKPLSVICTEAFSDYCFGDEVSIVGSNGWDTSDPEDCTMIAYYRHEDDEDDMDSRKISFHVRLEEGVYRDIYALEFKTGAEMGYSPMLKELAKGVQSESS